VKQKLATIFAIPWYPLAFCLYPPLALLAANLSQVRLDVVWRPLLVNLIGTGIAYLVLRLIFRDADRATFALVLELLLFFTYGHIYDLTNNWKIFGFVLGRNRALLPLWGVLFLLALWWVTRRKIAFRGYTVYLNFLSLFLLIFPLFSIFTSPKLTLDSSSAPVQPAEVASNEQQLPDIYYIILDSYGRSDLLHEVYGYDNSAFVDSLRDMGFYIADCSQSNYARTELSLASSLNMDYLQHLNPYFIPANNTDHSPLWDLIHNSAVRISLAKKGYQIVAFATGFPWTELTGANVYLSPQPSGIALNEFEGMLIQTTMLRILQNTPLLRANQASAENYRERTLYVFDSIGEVVRIQTPKFTFIHLIPPHPPFVFGANGEVLDQEDYPSTAGRYSDKVYRAGYIGQVAFINARIENMVRTIIQNSPIPPVIIIQGDHGPWNLPDDKQLEILNAYYLPGHETKLYPTITPVNSFRLVLNEYLNMHLEMLDDVSYYSPYDRFYEFHEIPNTCANP
jgi:hypothetical protein